MNQPADAPQPDDDLYDGFDAEAERVATLFAQMDRRKARHGTALPPPKVSKPGPSFGRALALGFANVFDPDRVKDDIVAVQERGDDDGDVPETALDPDDPTSTRVTYRAARSESQPD